MLHVTEHENNFLTLFNVIVVRQEYHV